MDSPPRVSTWFYPKDYDLADRIEPLLDEPDAIRRIFGDSYFGAFTHLWNSEKPDRCSARDDVELMLWERHALIEKAEHILRRYKEAYTAETRAQEAMEAIQRQRHVHEYGLQSTKREYDAKWGERCAILHEFVANARAIFSYNVMIAEYEVKAWKFVRRAEAGRRNGKNKKGPHKETNSRHDTVFGIYQAVIKADPEIPREVLWKRIKERVDRTFRRPYSIRTIRAIVNTKEKSAKTPIKTAGKKAK